jgi:hypothetical protein
VQSYGLNIIKDFPYFVVLIAILKYFNEQAWGFCADVFSSTASGEGITFSLDGSKFEVAASRIPLYLSLFGRGTTVVDITSRSPHPFNKGKTLQGQDMVVKIYWPEEDRLSEVELLNLAYAIESGENAGEVRGHLPVLVASGS